MTNKQRFEQTLADCYRELFITDPEYSYSAATISPESLARKITDGLHRGTANKDGEGIKRACKAMGINQSYKAIQAFFNGGSSNGNARNL
jgi:hypothetical protein